MALYLKEFVIKLIPNSQSLRVYIPAAEYSRFHDELGDFSLEWKSQDVFLFLRGIGDVEHIVILGVNRKTKKIKRLYFN